jgi:NitT/TauT family transport system substrate-binding protein
MASGPRQDLTLVEVGNSAIVPASIKSKQADLGVSSEPFITQLYKQGLWTQPIFNAGKELGPFVDTALSVRGDTLEKDPATVKSVVKAVVRALVYTNAIGTRCWPSPRRSSRPPARRI